MSAERRQVIREQRALLGRRDFVTSLFGSYTRVVNGPDGTTVGVNYEVARDVLNPMLNETLPEGASEKDIVLFRPGFFRRTPKEPTTVAALREAVAEDPHAKGPLKVLQPTSPRAPL